jgi:hypothetical protein
MTAVEYCLAVIVSLGYVMFRSPLSPSELIACTRKKATAPGPVKSLACMPLRAGIAILANHRLNTSFFCLRDRHGHEKMISNKIDHLAYHKYSAGLLLFHMPMLY